jgi:predicted nucleotidyltransferase
MHLWPQSSSIVFTADQVRDIMAVARPPFTALFLYGSHARGDAEESSDVDVLQVTSTHTAPYAVGRVNFTCYTVDQLLRLARSGSLFARHLVEEALPIADSQDVLGTLKGAYVGPLNYELVREEICGCAPLLDVVEPDFTENAEGLSSLVSYLIRSYLYAMAFDRGARSFAMGHVLDLLGQSRARIALSNMRSERNFAAFAAARKLFGELTGATCQRMEGSLEAFIVNASAHNNLAMILGLRLLARGRPFTYDALQDVEF